MNTIYKSVQDFPVLLDARDIKIITKLSRAGTYNLLNSEAFPIMRIGKRILISKEDFIYWLSGHHDGKESAQNV